MIHSEEIWRHPISKSIKYIVQCISSNKLNGNFGKKIKEQTLCRSCKTLQHIEKMGLNLTYFKAVFTKTPRSEELYNAQ